MSEIKKEKPTEKQKNEALESWSTWECDPSTFPWEYDSDEVAYVLEGDVTVKTDNGEMHVEPGYLYTFPKGLKCEWTVNKKIRKRYTFK